MKVSDFGDALWGSGVAEAQDRTTKITREKLIQMGVTHELAQAWYDFYVKQVARKRGLPTSAARVELMKRCLELLGDS